MGGGDCIVFTKGLTCEREFPPLDARMHPCDGYRRRNVGDRSRNEYSSASASVGTVRRSRGGSSGGQNRFSKNLIFKRFAAKFFSKVSMRFSKGQKGIV